MVSPKFVERFQQTTVAEGETVMLQCRAVGTPMPVLSWQKDGVTIENTANVMVSHGSAHQAVVTRFLATHCSGFPTTWY